MKYYLFGIAWLIAGALFAIANYRDKGKPPSKYFSSLLCLGLAIATGSIPSFLSQSVTDISLVGEALFELKKRNAPIFFSVTGWISIVFIIVGLFLVFAENDGDESAAQVKTFTKLEKKIKNTYGVNILGMITVLGVLFFLVGVVYVLFRLAEFKGLLIFAACIVLFGFLLRKAKILH